MADHDALGAACGARGVDHVRQPLGRRRGTHRLGRVPQQRLRLAVQVDRLHPGAGQGVAGAAVGHQHARAGILQHVRQPVGGVGRVEGEVGTSGLQDAEHRFHHPRAALRAERHQHLGPHPRRTEAVRQPVGGGVQLGVGAAAALPLQRHRVRGARGLPFEAAVHPLSHEPGRLHPVPLLEKAIALPRREQLQPRHRRRGRGGGGGQQRHELRADALDRRTLEEVGVVLQGAAEPLGAFRDHHRELVLGERHVGDHAL